MTRHFGDLGVKVRGVITYSLSPHEQRAFAGVLKNGVPNTIRRIWSQMFRVAPPFVLAYLVYDWGEKEHARLDRKNLKDFENEQ